MEIERIKKTMWVPRNCYYLKEKETPKKEEYLIKIVKGEHLELDHFQPKQIYYILDADPKLVLEFDPDEFNQIKEILKTN